MWEISTPRAANAVKASPCLSYTGCRVDPRPMQQTPRATIEVRAPCPSPVAHGPDLLCLRWRRRQYVITNTDVCAPFSSLRSNWNFNPMCRIDPIHGDYLFGNYTHHSQITLTAQAPPGEWIYHVRQKTVPLANVNSSSCSLYVVVRPSVCLSVVCRLSVTFVRPTQAIAIFGNIFTPFGTLTICWHLGKILRRSSQGNPSVGRVKHWRGSQI